MELKDLETFKCKSDELLFIRYKGELENDTLDVIKSIVEYCQENDTPCIAIPANDDEFYVELSQMDASQLRRLSDRIQEELKKKSNIIL